MRDTVEIGPVPSEERCEQLGPDYDPRRAHAECRTFIRQLTRQFGEPPGSARWRIKSSPHDFGTYCEVGVSYDITDEIGGEFAYRVEQSAPSHWDEIARAEIAELDAFEPFR